MDAVYVGRPSKWGNPHRTKPRYSSDAVSLYRTDQLEGRLPVSVEDVRRELRGKGPRLLVPVERTLQ